MVTDRIDLDEPHTIPDTNTIPCHPNVIIHRADEVVPWHIPDDRHRSLCLLNKLLEVIEGQKPDVIEANYLVPYGLVAYLASQITGIPYVLRHGGSDINKFLTKDLWPVLWRRALDGASLVITDPDSQATICKWSPKVLSLTPYVPDPTQFNSACRRKHARPVLALIGKANYYWQHKGWQRVIDVWSELRESFDFLIVSQGNGLDSFKEHVHSRLGSRTAWRPFVPPWEMPKLLNSIDGLFFYESELPFPVFSNVAVEALFCGVALFVDTDAEKLAEHYHAHGLNFDERVRQIVALPQDRLKAAAAVKRHYTSVAEYSEANDQISFEKYVLQNSRYHESQIPAIS